MDKEISILGAGGHAKVVVDIAEVLGYTIKSIYDQDQEVKTLYHYTVSNDVSSIADHEPLFFALGSNSVRKQNAEKFANPTINLIHPSAVLSKYSNIGTGNVFMAGAVVNSSTRIGNHCIINTGASIDHDCEIGDYVHISPGAAVAGNVVINEGAQIGIGACVKQNVTIGKWALVGAGAVVIRDVPDNAVVVGNPARILRR